MDIKTRCWCKEEKKFYYFTGIFNIFPFKEISTFPQYESIKEYIKLEEPELCIGLKDKNEKEIYEHDIARRYTDFNIEIHGNFVDYKVIIRNGILMLEYIKSEKGQVLPKGYTCGEFHLNAIDDISKRFYFYEENEFKHYKDIEIIGNGCENPELLENIK